MTLGEAIELAMGFERSAYDFYTRLSAKAPPEAKYLVFELAAEEKKHYELLERLSQDEDVAQYLSYRTKRPSTAEAFGNYVDLIPEPDELLEDSLLEYAKSRERIAYEHYAYLAEVTPAGSLKELFEFLRDEEARHERDLDARWSKIFSVF